MTRHAEYRIKSRLAPREKEVLLLMIEGLKDREIGEWLGIGPVAVSHFYQNAAAKIDCFAEGWKRPRVLAEAQKG